MKSDVIEEILGEKDLFYSEIALKMIQLIVVSKAFHSTIKDNHRHSRSDFSRFSP